MQPIQFPGSKEVKKPPTMTDEQCMSVWADSGIDNQGLPYYVTAWQPSYEDLQALNRGEPVYVKTISHGLPPMSLFTLDEEGDCNDAG